MNTYNQTVETCPDCSGIGWHGSKPCPTCKGSGKIVVGDQR